jgi:hypothetical protein
MRDRRSCALVVGLLLSLPAAAWAQEVPPAAPAASDPTGEGSYRELAGHLFLPSHLVTDPFSYTAMGLYWGLGQGTARGPTLNLGPPPSLDFQNTRDYGYTGLGLGLLLNVRLLEWLSARMSAEASAYLGTGQRSFLVVGTNAQITAVAGLKASLPVGRHLRFAASLDANYGPVFTALIAPGIIDAINSGQISLDQFLLSNEALTWIPAIAASYAAFPFLGVTVNARLLFPDGSGNAQFASSGYTLAAMAELDMMPLVSWMPIGLSGVYSITSPLGGRLATTQDYALGVFYTGVRALAAGIEINWRVGRLASDHVAQSTLAWLNLRYYWGP